MRRLTESLLLWLLLLSFRLKEVSKLERSHGIKQVFHKTYAFVNIDEMIYYDNRIIYTFQMDAKDLFADTK